MYRVCYNALGVDERLYTPWTDNREIAVNAFYNLANSGNCYSLYIEHDRRAQ
jgi:hypothetical protein